MAKSVEDELSARVVGIRRPGAVGGDLVEVGCWRRAVTEL